MKFVCPIVAKAESAVVQKYFRRPTSAFAHLRKSSRRRRPDAERIRVWVAHGLDLLPPGHVAIPRRHARVRRDHVLPALVHEEIEVADDGVDGAGMLRTDGEFARLGWGRRVLGRHPGNRKNTSTTTAAIFRR